MQAFGPPELRLMQGLAQQVTATRPELVNGDATVGELAWVWAKDYDVLAPFWRRRFWFEAGALVAWGWACLPYNVPRGDGAMRTSAAASLTWQTRPDRLGLLNEILDWFDEVAGEVERVMIIQSADTEAAAIVAALGYGVDAEAAADDGSWHQFNSRPLTDLPDPALPPGFRFVSAAEVSAADAVKVHLAAWDRSSFNETALARVQRTWPYRADLHPLVAAPDGTLVASAVVWLDEATRTAEFEPVGTHRDFRRRGIGAALQLHGMRLARAAGARLMLVACVGAPAHPAARDLYLGVGFRPFTHDLPQIKRGSG